MDWQVISKKLLISGFFKIWQVNLKFRKFNGDLSAVCDWRFIEKNEAVCAIIFDSKINKILLVRQFRLVAEFFSDDKHNNWPLEIIAGSIKPTENKEFAMIREIMEETKLEINGLTELFSVYPSPAIYGERLTYFYKEVDLSSYSHEIAGHEAENEDVQPVLFDIDRLIEMAKQGEVVDAKTCLATFWLQNRLNK